MHRVRATDRARATRRWIVAACLAAACVAAVGVGEAAPSEKPNVLFIAVDDLRPQLGCYGQPGMNSPGIDRLASRGVVFNRAYCMVPTCGASRASLMTGIRPARNRFVNYLTYAEKDAPGVTTLNTHFKNNGYYTMSLGKVFHHPTDNDEGWSEKPWRPSSPTYAKAENAIPDAHKREGRRRGMPFEAGDVADDFYRDGQLTGHALETLRGLTQKDQPFFLAVGYFKPHLPFVSPTPYWDRYDFQRVLLPDTYHRPKNAPDAAIHTWGELRAYARVPAKGPMEDEFARRLIQGYYACVSYTDAQIGRLLDEIDRLGIADDTIIVLWGDHGWNLGEHTLWCKHCCFETSMRAPLIVVAPMLQGVDTGATTDGLTEFIDIYPSLCDLAGLPQPEHLEGTSFVPLLKETDRPWKESAIGRYRQGDTIRTDRYRFTRYTDSGGKETARMLYDHRADPGEDNNVAEDPANAELVRRLTAELTAGMGKPTRTSGRP